MIKVKQLLILLLIAATLSSCGIRETEIVQTPTTEPTSPPTTTIPAVANDSEQNVYVFAMDTIMQLTAYGDGAAVGLADAQTAIEQLERLVSVTNADSELYRANIGDAVIVSDTTADLLETALSYCERTNGALDVTVYPVVRAWGFTTSSYQIPSDGEIAELLKYVDYSAINFNADTHELQLPQNVQIDLGAVAKGYASELAANALRSHGVTSALLSLGGNIQAVGAKPDGSAWRVAVQDPENPEEYAGILTITDKAVVTSGGYERYFIGDDGKTYWHIMNPATGYPADAGLISVTVVADSGTLADAMSTPLFVIGLDGAIEHWRQNRDFEAVFITDTHELYVTEGLELSFEPYGEYADAVVTVIR
jgi:thiamine biosynthesis lipoprotein